MLAHTMAGRKRLENIRELCDRVTSENVQGSFVECGVWRGGASIFARACLPMDRHVICCDSFQGLPFDQTEPDFNSYDFLAVTEAEVRRNFESYRLNENIRMVKGPFSETLRSLEGPIAILRADGDMFSSTIQILSWLYEKVSPGGYVIIDDWNLEPCRRAVEFYRDSNQITGVLVPIDGVAVYWQK